MLARPKNHTGTWGVNNTSRFLKPCMDKCNMRPQVRGNIKIRVYDNNNACFQNTHIYI